MDGEGATTQIKASGGRYRKKLLASNPENWTLIAEIVREGSIKGVLATITSDDYRRIVSPQYRASAEELLVAFASVPHVIFIHESVFFGEVEDSETPSGEAARGSVRSDQVSEVHGELEDIWADDERNHYYDFFGGIDPSVRELVNALLQRHELDVLPYKTNAERAVMASGFMEDNDRSLLFRVYVPAGRLYADEADRLLDLFQDWLGATGRASIRRDGYKTGAGQVYEFFGNEPSAGGELERQFADFSNFLDLCVDDSLAATARLEAVGVAPELAGAMTTRYARDARRLSLDLKHTRQTRIMQLSQTFENELLDEGSVDWTPIVEQLIPPTGSIVQAISPQAMMPNLPFTVHADSVNLTQQIFTGTVSNVIQSVQGTVHLNPDAKQLLEIIAQHGGDRMTELTTAVHELEDEDARAPERLTARQKLRAFLASVATEVPSMALQTLHKYLEQRIGLG